VVESYQEALFIKPDAEFIAIGAENQYKLLTVSDLSTCIHKNKVYLCDKPNYLRTKLSNSCVGAIYEKNKQAARRHCEYEKRPFVETVHQIETSTFILFSPERYTARFSCHASSATADITEVNRVYVAPGCHLQVRDHILFSSNHFAMHGNTEIYNWDFNPMSAPLARLADNGEYLLDNNHPPPRPNPTPIPIQPTTPSPIIPFIPTNPNSSLPVPDGQRQVTYNDILQTQLALAIVSIVASVYPLTVAVSSCYAHLIRCCAVVATRLAQEDQPQPMAIKKPKPTPRYTERVVVPCGMDCENQYVNNL